jgi:hypothetical protein
VSDLAARIAALSPHQREALLRRLPPEGRTKAPAEDAGLPPLIPRPAERYRPFPLTEVQEVYWAGRSGYFDLPTPGSGANVHLTLDLADGVPFLSGLEDAIRRLAERHEVLKLVMLPEGRQQILEDPPPFRLERIDLRALSPEPAHRECGRLVEALRYRCGRVGRRPLFGVSALLLPGGDVRLSVWLDAWVIDGRSRDVLLDDLLLLLREPGRRLPPLDISYRDYALYRQELRQSARYRRDREFWLDRIDTIPPPPELPLAVEPSPALPARFTRRSLRLLDVEGWRALRARAARRGHTPSAPLVAAFATVLRAWSARPAFTFGIESTDKPPVHPRLPELVGNFNTVHLLTVREGASDLACRTQDLQDQLVDCLEHATFSGFQVLRELARRRGRGRHSLMPVLFNSLVEFAHAAHRRARRPAGAAATTVSTVPLAEGASVSGHLSQVLLLVAVLEQGPGELHCEIQSVDDAFPAGLIDRLGEAFSGLVRRLALDDAPWSARDVGVTPRPSPRAFVRRSQAGGVPASSPGDRGADRRGGGDIQVLEAELRRLAAKVLHVAEVGPEDDFFELGGTSFTAVLLLAEVAARFGGGADLGEFLARPTVFRLAEILASRPPLRPAQSGRQGE